MIVTKSAFESPALASIGCLRRRWSGRSLSAARDRARTILETIPPLPNVPPPNTWTIHRALWTETEVAVLAVGPADRPPIVILKLPGTIDGIASLRMQYTMLMALYDDPRLEGWRGILPQPLATGTLADQFYLAERALPGSQAQTLLANPALRERVQRDAATVIGELHRRTATPIVVDSQLLDCWVERPLRRIRNLRLLMRKADHKAVDRLSHELHGTLIGQRLSVSWIHGDLWPGNLLVLPTSGTLTGIVDWDMAGPGELPAHDLLHLLLYTRALVQHRDLGEIVCAQIAGHAWEPHEYDLLDALIPPFGDTLTMRTLVLLYWLRHIESNLVQSPHYARHWVWLRKNIGEVLRSI